jgi:hypothetical protein
MNEQQIKDTLDFLEERYNKELEQAENSLEKKMLEQEFNKNKKLVMEGINIFASKSNDSDYECIGCGA